MLTSPSQLQALVNLFHQGTRLTYKKGEFIIRPGDNPSGVFYIAEGMVKAYDITKYGEENLLVIRKQGDILGLTWTLTGDNRNIVYSALSPTTVLFLKREVFMNYIEKHPRAALPLVEFLVQMYRVHSERIMNLEYRTVRERLVSFLVTTSRRFGKETPEGILVDVPLRHQDIASSISATRETTSRELAALERLGLLESKHSLITIKDMDRLRHYLE